jgi:hypothetical protein
MAPRHRVGAGGSTAVRRKGGLTAASPIDLADLLRAFSEAVVSAQRALDATIVEVAKQYQSDLVLRHVTPPAFAIGEVRCVVKCAIADGAARASKARGGRPMRAHVDAATLADVPAHLISEFELRFVPALPRLQSAAPTADDSEIEGPEQD